MESDSRTAKAIVNDYALHGRDRVAVVTALAEISLDEAKILSREIWENRASGENVDDWSELTSAYLGARFGGSKEAVVLLGKLIPGLSAEEQKQAVRELGPMVTNVDVRKFSELAPLLEYDNSINKWYLP